MQLARGLTVVLGLLLLVACAGTGNQIVLLGEATIPGSQAVGEANVAIRNANAAGCNAISVGGYGLAGEGTLIGIPVLVECPRGVSLLPNGARTP
tara:strand:- start:3910 stop:4194 length:285 start_codon:yes stop_codon:yes gene_type:complete